MTILLSAKPVAESLQADLKGRVEQFRQKTGRVPKLAVVLVGEDPASVIYTTRKGQQAMALGMEHQTLKFPADTAPQQVQDAVTQLNEDPSVDGILIQRPLPKTFEEESVAMWVAPEKDVDAFHPVNTGRLHLGLRCFQPCTPSGIMELLKFHKIPVSGKLACVIGRSSIVGKPMAALLLQANATVIQAHSRTSDLRALTLQADILVAAAGIPGIIDASYVKRGAVVIDVGIHRTAENKLTGDVTFDEVSPLASAITPVPGGVGPMTIVMLLSNTVQSAEIRGK
ncbi:MAG: bifunctional 5,10-methylenetetrahydrofolate dehydrogenase/5,10-methenyltetrahydrofolate cyclohydrolase [Methylotenera sp.]|nr:bifunctional 5,10-methylenetetrahydrofolate dehydrogenase/5,10-methenyltetrahydrofolate cyclohydrolase [Oligoflexia bacterium]